MAASRDEEARKVVAELDGLLDALRANVAALTAILPADDKQEGAPCPSSQ